MRPEKSKIAFRHPRNVGSGDLSGTNITTELLINSDKSIVASFAPNWKLTLGDKPKTTDGFNLILNGEVGMKYSIEFSSGLLNWTPLVTVTNSSNTTVILDRQATYLQRRFYRAIMVP